MERRAGYVIALIASAGLALRLAALADAQCTNDAGPGDHDEGEACGDQTNGGCNQAFDELFAADFAGDGEVRICGQAPTYDAPGTTPCAQNSDCLPPNLPVCQGGFCLVNRRDTDWYRINLTAFDAADSDNNGVVQIRSHIVSGFDSVTLFVSLGDPTCSTVTVLNSVGCGGPQGTADSVETVIINDNPNGIVAFVAPGMCSGAGIFDGYECDDVPALTDYILTITLTEPPTACADPASNPNLLPCNTPNSIPGCEDPACCKQVCATLPLCCVVSWSQNCATAAVNLGCAGFLPLACIATGPSSAADGYLQVCPDPLGAWADVTFGGQGDLYNPVGALVPQPVSFSNAFFLYRAAQLQREMLSTNVDWQPLVTDASLSTEILCVNPGPNCLPGSVASDTNNDGVLDHLLSKFRVTGDGVDLTFDLTQEIDLTAPPTPPVAVLAQTYSIHDNLADPISFVLLRQCDFDLVWPSPAPDPDDFNDDSVGTGTNGSSVPRHVSQGESGTNATYITISSPTGARYVGAKSAVDPDGPGPGPPFGAGTDTQEWAAYGVPVGWGNFIAYVGANTNGYSATQTGDGHIDLEVPVSIPGNGTVSVSFDVTYGSKNPLGQGPCPWDCASPADGHVNVLDFLALLAQWGQVGAFCDIDGGGVSITDFLNLLGHWGACPP